MATIIEFPRTRGNAPRPLARSRSRRAALQAGSPTSLYCWTWDGADIKKRLRADVGREPGDFFAFGGRLLGTICIFDTEKDAVKQTQIFRKLKW